jgi:hypothetical protein
MEDLIDRKQRICDAGLVAVDELIKIAEAPIVMDGITMETNEEGEVVVSSTNDDLSADKLTNAAKAKKLAIMDAFEILDRVGKEQVIIESMKSGKAEDNLDNPMASRIKK